MAKRLQHRGGTTSQHSTFTGAVREVTVDTDKNTLVVHDGATAGGHPLATATNFTSTGIDDNATSTSLTIASDGRTTLDATNEKALVVHHSDGNTVRIGMNNDITNSNEIAFEGTSFVVKPGGFEKFRIDSSGNVGIGETSMDALLVIKGDSNSSTNPSIRLKDGTDSREAIVSNQSGDLVLATMNSSDNVIDSAITIYTSQMIFKTNGSEAMRFDNSQNVGIGTTSPSNKLVVQTTSDPSEGTIIVQRNSEASGAYCGYAFRTNASNTDFAKGAIYFEADGTGYGRGDMLFCVDGGATSPNEVRPSDEKMRIDSGGSVLIGGTNTDPAVNGTESIALRPFGRLSLNVDGSVAARIGRTSTDGSIVAFYQGGTQEGDIQINGTTTSYNGFTGTHWSRFTDNSTPTILKGTVLETLDEMCDWYNLEFDITTTKQDKDGNDVINTITKKIPHVLLDTQSNGDVITYNHEGTDYQATIVKEGDIKHMKAKVSNTVDAKNVYGLFVAYDLDGEGYNDFFVASVGSYVVRIKANETIAKGDLLQSNGDGTAKVQSDDNIKSSSFAKVLSTTIIETYEDGSYLVPCSLMC